MTTSLPSPADLSQERTLAKAALDAHVPVVLEQLLRNCSRTLLSFSKDGPVSHINVFLPFPFEIKDKADLLIPGLKKAFEDAGYSSVKASVNCCMPDNRSFPVHATAPHIRIEFDPV